MIKKNNNLKVLLLSPLPPPAGGIASWTEQYIEWANKDNLNLDIVNTAVVGNRSEEITNTTNVIDEIKRTIKILNSLKKKIKKIQPDIIHLNTPCGQFGIIRDYICGLLAKKFDISLVVHYRCNIQDQIKNRKIPKFFLKKMSRMANLNIVLNKSSQSYLNTFSGTKSQLLANFISEDYILDRPKKINKNIKEITFVGHGQQTKGINEIIEVAQVFPDLNFNIVGPMSKEIILEERISNLIYYGILSKDKVREIMIKSDIFLFPSYTEGFANVMLEAMATGTPIITTPVGANVEMIGTMGGVIVSISDVESIVEAIKSLSNPELRENMSNWNVKKVKEDYTINKVMSKLISYYEDVLI